MRKFILLTFLVVNTFFVFAQKYQPVDSNMVWNTHNLWRFSSNACCYAYEDASFQFHGYSNNNGNNWLKLYKSVINSKVACPQCTDNFVGFNYTNFFIGYILNDSINKKVYFTQSLPSNFNPGGNDIVYDFLNKNIGDTLTWRPLSAWTSTTASFQILSIDSFQFSGKYHKRYKAINNTHFSPPRNVFVMEGMGSTLGPWNSIFTQFEQNSSLSCFSNKQQAVSVSNFTVFTPMPTSQCATINMVPEVELPVFSISPNPVSTILNITDLDAEHITITDIFGKVVLEQNENASKVNVQALPSGLYMIRLSSRNRIFISKFIKE